MFPFMLASIQTVAHHYVTYLSSAVTAPVITITGGEKVYHKQGVPYHDMGAKAQVFSPDHTYVDVRVTTVRNTVPSSCDNFGKYFVQYEAAGPHGLYVTRAQRTVQIGWLALVCMYYGHCFELERAKISAQAWEHHCIACVTCLQLQPQKLKLLVTTIRTTNWTLHTVISVRMPMYSHRITRTWTSLSKW